MTVPVDLSTVPVYAVNLDSRPDRWAATMEACGRAGLSIPERWPGIDGRATTTDEELEGWVGNPDRPHTDDGLRRASVGIVKAKIGLCEHLLERDEPWALMIEDDTDFVDGLLARWREFAPRVPDDANCVLLGSSFPTAPEHVHLDVYRVRRACGGTATLARPGFWLGYLAGLRELRLSSDQSWYAAIEMGHTYAPGEALATQVEGFSDRLGRNWRPGKAVEGPDPLKSKAAYTDEQAASVWASIPDIVSAEEAEEAVELAARETRATIGSRKLDQVVYGWSGGKDSLALEVVMERAGVRRALIGIVPAVEWTEYMRWLKDHGPEDLAVVANREVDLPFLAEHDHLVFPRNSRDGYWWTLQSARHAQLRYQEVKRPELQIFGRRTQDGNACGDERGILRTQDMVAYSPMRHWSHELVLGVIHHFGKELPPVYGWPHGWTAGTGSWPGRRVGTIEQSWAETFAIEPDAVREAANYLPGAYDWLAARNGLNLVNMPGRKRFKQSVAIKDFEGTDVWEAAKQRMHHIYDMYDLVTVSFSGGKDSTATLHVALEVAAERDKLPLRAVFYDEEAIPYETEDYVRRVSQRDDVDLRWYCIPLKENNACSTASPVWWPWAPEDEHKWVREMPPEALTLDTIEHWPAEPHLRPAHVEGIDQLLYDQSDGQVCVCLGLRAAESLQRWRAVNRRSHDEDNYITGSSTRRFPTWRNINKAYPIYDWDHTDVWTAPDVFGWDYNEAYDIMAMAGIGIANQRCSPPFGTEPLAKLHTYATCFPDIWEKMVDRVPGADTAARYALTELYGWRELPHKPDGQHWLEFIKVFLERQDDVWQSKSRGQIEGFIKTHFRQTTEPILVVNHPTTGLNWGLLLMIALRGDPRDRKQPMRAMGVDEHEESRRHYEECRERLEAEGRLWECEL